MNANRQLKFAACALILAFTAQAASIYWEDGDSGSGTITSAGWNDIQTAIRKAEGGLGTVGTVKLNGNFTRSDTAVGALKVTNGWVQLSGGWDSGFTAQSGRSTLNVNGGGYSACQIAATNVALSNLVITGGASGGIQVWGYAAAVALTDCAISNNTGSGGLAISYASDIRLLRCDIVNNSSTGKGGGVSAGAHVGDSGLGLVIDNCTIAGNTAANSGGGLNFGYEGDAVGMPNRYLVVNSRITGNQAAKWGAGVDVEDSSTSSRVLLFNCLVQSNRQSNAAALGAGIYKRLNSTAYIVNSTVVDNINTADASRPGIFVDSGWYGASNLRFVNSVVVSNNGAYGNTSGYLSFQRTTAREARYVQGSWDNRTAWSAMVPSGDTNSLAAALAFASPHISSVNDAGAVTQNLEQNLETDPVFLGIGATPYQLSPYSPCVDSGLTKTGTGYTYVNANGNGGAGGTYDALLDLIVSGTPPAGSNFVYTTDLLGKARLTGSAVDRGAYEFAMPPVWIECAAAANVLPDSADMMGNLVTGDAPVSVTCYWGPADGGARPGAWAHTNDLGVQAVGTIACSVSALTSGQTYYYRLYATNSLAECWAYRAASFTTPGSPGINNAGGATAIGPSSAALNGVLAAGNPSPAAWVCWGATDGGTDFAGWDHVIALGQPGLGAISAGISGLLASTQYWYRCVASNVYGTTWAAASTNFTTIPPTLTATPLSGAVTQGLNGTSTSLTYTVTLSATSALPVSVHFATADGTATVLANGYVPASGTLVIPAGSMAGAFVVTVLGTNVYNGPATFYVNLSSPTNVTLGTTQVSCSINSAAPPCYYVRGDGQGNDANDGSDWLHAFATLGHALARAPTASMVAEHYQITQTVKIVINVQASAPGTWYQAAARTVNAPLNLDFEGGWQNVGGTPAQTGLSVVQDATTNHAGISIQGAANDGRWRLMRVSGFNFTNVSRGIEVVSLGYGLCDVLLSVSNVNICATADGIFVYYPVDYLASSHYGGPAVVNAQNVDVVAGTGGAGYGLYVFGSWSGSCVVAVGMDPASNVPRVSSITGRSGGVCLSGYDYDPMAATFSNLVIYGCTGHAIHLDAATDGTYADGSNRVSAALQHCTLADNTGDAVNLVSSMAPSGAVITNCIVANNGGHGVNMVGGPVFSCAENYNVFFNDDVYSNGVAQALAANTSSNNPVLYAARARPDPWYLIASSLSPAYKSALGGGNRGAYQVNRIPGGTVVLFR